MALPSKNRLKNKKDFDVIFKKGKALNGSFLFIKILKSSLGYPRFGFIIASKFAPKAVVRNRVRRILDSVIIPQLLPNMPSCDTVVVVTKKIPPDVSVIRDDFAALLEKSKIL